MHRSRQLAGTATVLRGLLHSRLRHPLNLSDSTARIHPPLCHPPTLQRSVGVLVEYGLLPAEDEVEAVQEEVIVAYPRALSGKISAKKERKVGRCASIVYEQRDGHLGGHKNLISVDSRQIMRLVKKYGRPFFLSKTFDLEIIQPGANGEILKRERVLPRQIHLHAGNDHLLNVTFLRTPPEARIKVDVPLMFIGEDACAGIRKGGYLNTIRRTVRFECPGNMIPPHIEVDLSTLNIGDKILLSDLKVSPEISLVGKDPTLPVCKIGGRTTPTDASI